MSDYICPNCGGDMEHWNMGIYECVECDLMIDADDLDEIHKEWW